MHVIADVTQGLETLSARCDIAVQDVFQESWGSRMTFDNDSRALVSVKGDAAGRDKSHQEKWLIYCPSIASDTLLYMVSQYGSYSLRSYGGRLGVNIKGMHAQDAHSTAEFEKLYEPLKWREMSHAELAVGKTERWAFLVNEQWKKFQDAK